MFIRVKKNHGFEYLQLVHSQRVGSQVRQRVLGTLGRRDLLENSPALAGLAASLNKYLHTMACLVESRPDAACVRATRSLGPGLVFGRLWAELDLPALLGQLLQERHFGFPIERAVFLTVLHRLLAPAGGTSDRAAEKWQAGYEGPDQAPLELQHLYRAMAWLGEELAPETQEGATPFAPRCTKDAIEEALFQRRHDLFSELSLAFFDTTSLYFEGQGGESLGRHGHSKDHRPDLKQMVVGMVLDGDGRPVCSELWPGNTPDVKTLLPVVRRLEQRFGIQSLCVVADRGMISRATIAALEDDPAGLSYILGARLRSDHEVRDMVLSWGGAYHEVHGPRTSAQSPAPLKVKDVRFTGEDGRDRRYVVCHNPEQAQKDRADREAIVAALQDQLQRGDKALVGNRGFRKYLRAEGKRWTIDRQKVEEEVRYDGKWVLRTNRFDLSAANVALRYKDLWRVEAIFRTTKSVLETRPIYHRCDETIRGHVFCSFLALVLMKELEGRLAARGLGLEWADVVRDLEALRVTTVDSGGAVCELRSAPTPVAGAVIQAVGVALGPTVRFLEVAGRKPAGREKCSATARG
jgi:transposase